MIQGEPCANNALCIGSNNNLNVYTSLLENNNPHFNEKCFVICLVQYIDENPIELYFTDKKKWIINNINKATKFTYKDALKELYFLNKSAGYGLNKYYSSELQLIDLYIYYSDEEDI